MNKRGILILLFACSALAKDWTWNYEKHISVSEAKQLADKKQFVYIKEGTPKYTQLILSWNAHRPKQGHYTFYVQPRNAVTKQWAKNWIKMMEWGDQIQRSHCITKEPEANYFYVRLEGAGSEYSDAFKIKAECNNGASLENLRLINVCISDLLNFMHQDPDGLENLQSVEIKGIPRFSQFELGHKDADRMCSTTSLAMLLSYFTKRDTDPLEVAKGSYDDGLDAYGSWPFNTAHAFERHSKKFFKVQRLPSFKDLHGYLIRGIPVIVSIRGFIPTGALDYQSGHIILITGLNGKRKRVICHDPAFPSSRKVRHEYALGDFLKSWERSNRMAFVAENRNFE